METLQELERRIANAEDLQSLVRTMKGIAAVNVRQYERTLSALADYNRTTEMGLQVLLRHAGRRKRPPRRRRRPAVGAIVFGSDQGMCGQFNDLIAEYAVTALGELSPQPGKRAVLAVGLRAAASLEDAGVPADRFLTAPHSPAGITPTVQEVLWLMQRWQAEGTVDSVELFYNRVVSGASYEPGTAHLWPIDPERFASLESQRWPSRSIPTFTMDWDALFSALFRQHLFVSLYRAFSESLASENGSRLASMQVAERNIGEKLGELRALYHHRRQDDITSELLDIVSGFEALSDPEL